MILLSSRFLKREKGRKYWVHPILRYREDGVFLLIMEQQDYYELFEVYFRMSVAKFDALLPSHVLKRRPPVSVNSVCKDLYAVLCAARRSG